VATAVKSKEITAIAAVRKLLDLEAAVVPIDAMGCQNEIAAAIIAQKGESLWAVKDNPPPLARDIEPAFDTVWEHGEPGVDFTECQTVEAGHGRQETRTGCVITNPSGIRDAGLWAQLTAVGMVISERVVNGITSIEARYDDLGVDSLADGLSEVPDRGILLRRQGCGRHGWTPVPASGFPQPSPFLLFCTKIPPAFGQPTGSSGSSRPFLAIRPRAG
jgi:hypothetical protein